MSNEHSELFRAAEGVTLDGAKPVVRLPAEREEESSYHAGYNDALNESAEMLREQGFEVTHD